jgi:dissimilatory sulfite reductase (desulfoviridin) alpha/beta subunit
MKSAFREEQQRAMQWDPAADDAVSKVPFFVRKKVRARVEQEASAAGKHQVSLADVKATQKRYLAGMASQVKGYQLDACFGSGGCPNRAVESEALLNRIEALMEKQDLLPFLKSRVKGDLKFHHEFRISLADCPNACSQVQIKDIGIIGAAMPRLIDEPCSQCGACVDACKEEAILLKEDSDGPQIDMERCLACKKCSDACPTGTIAEGPTGYRLLLGGKLGRHPRLARELPGIFTADEVLEKIEACVAYYKAHSRNGMRFAELIQDKDLTELF